MILTPSQYAAIHELLNNKVAVREIARLLNIHRNTVTATSKRVKHTGSPLPAQIKNRNYEPATRALQDAIAKHLGETKPSCRRNQRKPLTDDAIYAKVAAGDSKITRTRFNELLAIEKSKRKASPYEEFYHAGDIVEFAWGSKTVNLDGTNQPIYVAVYVPPYSDYLLGYVTKDLSSTSFVETFTALLQDLQGTPSTLVIGSRNLTRKVQSLNHLDPQTYRLFEELGHHYGLKIHFGAPYLPEQKSRATRGMKLIQQAIESAYVTDFTSLDHVQSFVDQVVAADNEKEHPYKNDTRQRLFAHERTRLRPLPKRSYSYFEEDTHKVYRDSLIRSGHARYSVPEGYQGKTLRVRYRNSVLYVLADDHSILAKHQLASKKQTRRRIWHALHRVQAKPEGFRQSEDYRSLPRWLKRLHDIVFRSDTRLFVAFLLAIQDQPKDLVKCYMRRCNLSWEELQPEKLNQYAARLKMLRASKQITSEGEYKNG